MNSAFLTVQYDASIVALSFLIASFAAYVAFDLARRVSNEDPVLARVWWMAGSLAMGTGIWATHFVGMMAMTAPFSVGFSYVATALSWLAAVTASCTALFIAAMPRLTSSRLALGALVMGSGIASMHYVGMSALDMRPTIKWTINWVWLSIAIAIAASAAALWVFFELKKLSHDAARVGQAVAALVMGAAICGMHYAGMMAANFPLGSVCRSATDLGGEALKWLVAGATLLLLTQTLLTSIVDTRMKRHAANLEFSWRSKASSLQKMAFRDPLTGLPNRLLLDDRLALAVERCARDGTRLAVLFIDLDGFKPVNDNFGHRFGDAVLVEMSRRLAEYARSTDTVTRVGGDEFVVLIEGNPDNAAVSSIAQRIIDGIAVPFKSARQDVRLGCSIGIATHPDDAPGETVISCADAAMYCVKRRGGGSLAFFEAGMVNAEGELPTPHVGLRRVR